MIVREMMLVCIWVGARGNEGMGAGGRGRGRGRGEHRGAQETVRAEFEISAKPHKLTQLYLSWNNRLGPPELKFPVEILRLNT